MSSGQLETAAARLRAALDPVDLDALAALLDDNVRWGGQEDTPQTCHSRVDVVSRLTRERQHGVQATLIELKPGERGILVALSVRQPPSEPLLVSSAGRFRTLSPPTQSTEEV